MITIDSYTIAGYTLLIDGNDGEEQLVIVVSYGQSDCRVAVVSATVDMGLTARTARTMANDKAGKYIRRAIRTWCLGDDYLPEDKKDVDDNMKDKLPDDDFFSI